MQNDRAPGSQFLMDYKSISSEPLTRLIFIKVVSAFASSCASTATAAYLNSKKPRRCTSFSSVDSIASYLEQTSDTHYTLRLRLLLHRQSRLLSSPTRICGSFAMIYGDCCNGCGSLPGQASLLPKQSNRTQLR